jgi:hypothetical protein
MLHWDPKVKNKKYLFKNNLITNTKTIKKRISVSEALLHPYFYENPRPSLPEEIRILKKLE